MENPEHNQRLYRLLAVNGMVLAGLDTEQIANELGISARHARSYRRPQQPRGSQGASIRPLRREAANSPSLGLLILASVTAPVGEQQHACAGFRIGDSGRQISG